METIHDGHDGHDGYDGHDGHDGYDDIDISYEIDNSHHVEISHEVRDNNQYHQHPSPTSEHNTFIVLPLLFNAELAMSKISMSGSTFNAPVQIGDHNKIEIDDFNSYVNTSLQHGKSHEAAPLLIELHALLVESHDIQEPEKFEAKKNLRAVTKEISKSETERSESKLKEYWKEFVSLTKDVGSLFGIVSSIGKILGLPLP